MGALLVSLALFLPTTWCQRRHTPNTVFGLLQAAAEQEASEAAQQIAELQEVAGVMQEGLLGVCEEVAGVLGLEPLDWSGLAAGELVGQAQVREGLGWSGRTTATLCKKGACGGKGSSALTTSPAMLHPTLGSGGLVVTLVRAECCGVPYCAAMVCVLCRPCFLMFHPLPPLAPTLLSTPLPPTPPCTPPPPPRPSSKRCTSPCPTPPPTATSCSRTAPPWRQTSLAAPPTCRPWWPRWALRCACPKSCSMG